MVVHHSGKSGDQRGTSKRLDVVNTVLNLSLQDSEDENKTVITLNFSKHRGFFGEDAASRRITMQDGIWSWTLEAKNNREIVKQFLKEGMKQSEISRELGFSRQYISKLVKQMKNDEVAIEEMNFMLIQRNEVRSSLGKLSTHTVLLDKSSVSQVLSKLEMSTCLSTLHLPNQS